MRYLKEQRPAGTAEQDLSARELTSRLGEQLTTLARAEIALAKAELFARGRQAVMGGGLFGAAGIVGAGAYLALIAAAIAGIAVALPVWAAALIVGVLLGALAGGLALAGKRRVARGMPPLPVTADTIRRDVAELASRNGNGGRARQEETS